MAHPTMSSIERLGVDAVEMPQSLREIGLRSFYQQMVMIVHQHPGMTHHLILVHHRGYGRHKPLPIGIIPDNRLPGIAARGDMVDCTSVLQT